MRLTLGTLSRRYAFLDPDPEVVADAVSAWRHWLNKELPHALEWDESPTAPFEIAEVGEWDALVADGPDQLTHPNLWLPGDHDFLFDTQDLAETEIRVGSSAELLRALGGAPDCPARRVLARLARRSLQFRLPLAKGSL
jgi:hypothetical protein